MNQLLLKPRARSTDPHTSHQAASSVGNISELHQTVYTTLLHYGPLTDPEMHDIVARVMDVSPSGPRSRRAELVKMGFVQDSGRTSETPGGRRAVMWQATR